VSAVGLRTTQRRSALRSDDSPEAFDDFFGGPAATCATLLMLFELALQDLATAEGAAFAAQRRDAHKLLASALTALRQLEQDVWLKTNSEERGVDGALLKSPQPLRRIHRQLQRVQEALNGLTALDAIKAWHWAAQLTKVSDELAALDVIKSRNVSRSLGTIVSISVEGNMSLNPVV
jgi:hypothetical protein